MAVKDRRKNIASNYQGTVVYNFRITGSGKNVNQNFSQDDILRLLSESVSHNNQGITFTIEPITENNNTGNYEDRLARTVAAHHGLTLEEAREELEKSML